MQLNVEQIGSARCNWRVRFADFTILTETILTQDNKIGRELLTNPELEKIHKHNNLKPNSQECLHVNYIFHIPTTLETSTNEETNANFELVFGVTVHGRQGKTEGQWRELLFHDRRYRPIAVQFTWTWSSVINASYWTYTEDTCANNRLAALSGWLREIQYTIYFIPFTASQTKNNTL